jgi:hypothetical protein
MASGGSSGTFGIWTCRKASSIPHPTDPPRWAAGRQHWQPDGVGVTVRFLERDSTPGLATGSRGASCYMRRRHTSSAANHYSSIRAAALRRRGSTSSSRPLVDSNKFGPSAALPPDPIRLRHGTSPSGPKTDQTKPAPGTIDEKPRWEGPPENRPRGYLPPLDDPKEDREAAGENSMDQDNRLEGTELPADGDEARDHAEPAPKDTRYAGHPEFAQDAASNKRPEGIGNSEPVDDNDERTRHSDGMNPPRPSTPQPTSGAAQALARHSKDG